MILGKRYQIDSILRRRVADEGGGARQQAGPVLPGGGLVLRGGRAPPLPLGRGAQVRARRVAAARRGGARARRRAAAVSARSVLYN